MIRPSRSAALVAAPALLLACVAARPLLGQGAPPDDPVKADRWRLHLSTDRPTYRPGETVLLRGPMLHAFTQRPRLEPAACQVEVTSPRGEVVTSAMATVEQGALAFTWAVPADAAGGRYTLVARPLDGQPAGEVEVEVLAYRVPRLRTDLQLARKGYGAGEEVEALLTVTRAEGGVPAGAKVTAIARVDGREAARQTLALDAQGRALVRLRLPAKIDTPEATLACVIEDGGVLETAARTIPILLARLRVALFAEGGDLVAGLGTRVYFEARTLTDDPADVRGKVIDDAGRDVARFATEHEGRGRFELVPQAGRTYRLVVEEPRGIMDTYPLPPVRPDGVTLAAHDEVIAAGAPLRVLAAGTAGQGDARLSAFVHDREVASATIPVGPEPRLVSLPLPAWTAGVVRITLVPARGAAAERLVLRRQPDGLRVAVTATPAASTPRARVKVVVRTTGPDGQPLDAFVAVSAVDDAALARIEPRHRAPRLPVQALLGADVRELKDAHVYLDDATRGPRATDLLLGVQGWRRHAWRDQAAFTRAHGDDAWRALALADPAAAERLRRELQREEMDFMADGAVLEGAGGAVPAEARAGEPPPAPAAPEQQAAVDQGPQAQPMAPEPKRDDERQAGARARPMPLRRPAATRAYSHRAAGGGARGDFAETLLWTAGGPTGADGALELEFDLSDSITTFRLVVDAAGNDGALAWGETEVTARRPLYVEPKLPLEVTAGDRVLVPVAVVNGAATPQAVRLTVRAGEGLVAQGPPAPLTLAADERRRVLVPLEVGAVRGEVEVGLDASGPGPDASDAVTRRLKVVPRGFPIEHAWGGLLEPGGTLTRRVAIPEGYTPASLEAEAVVHATPLATLAEALAALVREPGGCFEQTSSNHYPNVMIMRYLTSHAGVDPALIVNTRATLDRGYQRLVSFECKEKGYEWFGGDPGHEALTAYGLLEFSDMQGLHPVDQGMLARTRAWLLARRDGQGGFQRNPRALDSFGAAPADVTDAYITWALVMAGEQDVTKEVEAVLARARATDDPYVVALAANVALERGAADQARDLMTKLVKKQAADGGLDGAGTSITGSGGLSLRLETTSLAALAWLRSPDHTAALEKAMLFLLESCKGGRFGSTQATVLTLRAVLAYDAARARPAADGTVLLLVDGKVVDEGRVSKDATGAIRLPRFVDALGPGEHEVSLKMVGGARMPASVVVRYRAETPADAPGAALTVSTSLADAELTEGEATEVRVRVESSRDTGLPMAVAIVGLPGGLEVRTERLEELRRAGAFDLVETRGREVILYWRSLPPNAVKEVSLSVIAAIPGRYTGPASRTYLYYTDEDKRWAPGLEVTIAPRE
jgi:hypothetical protein